MNRYTLSLPLSLPFLFFSFSFFLSRYLLTAYACCLFYLRAEFLCFSVINLFWREGGEG